MTTQNIGIRLSVSGEAQVKGALGGVERSMGSFASAAKSAIGPLAGLLSAGATLGKLVQVQREFDVLNSSLKTVTGSSAAAAKEMEWIKQFAKETPFGLAQATQGFVKMKALGLDPSRAALTSFGNTASAMGKDLNQMIEAVADAATGEFERLKEFGVKSKKEGDQVKFTFQGVTTSIGNNAAEITKYLEGLGNNQFAGAMAERANTLDGAIASLGDTWDDLFRTVSSQGTGNLIHDSVRLAEGAVTDLTTIFQALNAVTGENASQTGAMASIQDGLALVFERVAIGATVVKALLVQTGDSLGGLAAMAVAVADGNLAGAKAIYSEISRGNQKAIEDVTNTTNRILGARAAAAKLNALGQPNNYDEPAVIRARAAAEKALADAKAATAKAAADATKQEASAAAASKTAAAEAKKAAEADLEYRRRYTQELIKSLDDAAQAELAYQAALDARKFDEAFEADQRHLAAVEARIKAGRTALEQIEFETSLLALNTTEREVATAMRELERQGVIKGTEAYAAYAAKIEAAIRTREGKNAETKAADEAAKAWQKASEDIERSLTDALMRGFESGKGFAEVLRDTVANMFSTLVLRPVVQAIVQPVAGSITGALGMGGQGGAMGAINTASSLYSAYGAAGTAGGFAGSLGSAASYGTAIGGQQGAMLAAQEMGMGTLAGSAGSIGAALPSIGAGLAVLSLIDSLDDSGTMHTGGVGGYSAAGGARTGVDAGLRFGVDAKDYTASSQQAAVAMAQAVAGMLDSTATTFGAKAGYYAATAFADDTSKDGAWGALMVKLGDQVLADWANTPDRDANVPRVFADGEAGARQYAAAVALDVRNLLLEQTPGWADTMLNALGDAPSIEQLGAVVGQINMVQNALVDMGRASEAFAAMGEQATTALIAAMGGAEASVASLSSYYSDFYSESERAEIATATLTAEFAALGQELPASRLGLRAMIDAAIEAGDPALAGKLVNLSGRFAALVPTAEEAAAAVAKAAEDMQSAFDALISSARASLESVVAAESAVADLELQARIDQANAANEAARAMGDAAQSLRDYVQGQVATPQQQFADVLRLAMQGDAAAMQALPSAATAAADAARANASTAAEAAIARARTLVGVNAAADLAQSRAGLVPVPTAESPMEAALRKLTQAIDAMAADVSSAISFDLVNKLGEIDTSGNLAIELDEFRTAFGSMASEATLAKVFATLDADGNGQITLLESINKNTAAMLTGIYQQMLGRAPDATGVASFAGMSAAQIEAAIKASPEYKIKEALGAAGQANYIQSVAAGASPDAARLYADLLGRAIDSTGLQAFAGMGAAQIEAAIKASPEYQQRIALGTLAQSGASTANPPAPSVTSPPASAASAFAESAAAGATFAVAEMYATLLGRAADPVGIQAFNGMSAAQIEAAIKASPEYQQKIRGYATGGYTGPGGQYEPAGIVHAGEVVWSQADVARWGGWRNVDAMRTAVPLPPTMPDWGGHSQPSASADRALVAEIQALRAEVQGLRAEARATAINTGRTEQLMKRVTRNGEAMQTEAAT